MKRSFLLLSTVIVLLPLNAEVADTISVTHKLRMEQSNIPLLRSQVWENTAMHFYRRNFNITTIDLKGKYSNQGNAALAQEGNKERGFSFEVSSFILLDSENRLFGKASYYNGKTDNVLWNENSDYAVLYPYVVGDSIGGFMKEEEYKFSGGYARRFGQWTAGAELGYRAVMAYRDKDPRPRNVISDLEVSIAASRKLGNQYSLGIALRGRKYNQRSDITFLADQGSTSVYQMLGLGVDYVRFAGTVTSTRYNGSGIGGSIDLLPTGKDEGTPNGFSASLGIDYFHLTKELTAYNNAPCNEIKNTEVSLEAAWTHKRIEWEYGIGVSASLQQRTGIENIFGDPTGNVYPLLSSINQFKNNTVNATIKGTISQMLDGKRQWSWTINPFVSYWQTHPEYKGYARYLEIATMQGGIELQSRWQLSKWFVSIHLTGGYAANLKSEYSLPGLSSTSSVAQTLLANIQYLGDDHSFALLKLRSDYVFSSRYALYLTAYWGHQEYKACGGADRIGVSVGLTF